MATYVELYDLRSNPTLLHKVTVAVVKKAQTLLDAATPSANALAWAKKALDNPPGVAQFLFYYVLAANSAASVAVILAASDATIQTNVDAAADKFIAGGLV